jgi:hypothetical protein
MQGFGAVIAGVVLGALLLDEGDVVTLLDRHAGQEYETQLWIVELDGVSYLRARNPDAGWLVRIGSGHPVQLRREPGRTSPTRPYEATPSTDAALRERVDAAMAAKYGLADKLWATLAGRSHSLPVALAPALAFHADENADERAEEEPAAAAKPLALPADPSGASVGLAPGGVT